MTDPNLESCESGAHFAHPGEPCEEPEQAPASLRGAHDPGHPLWDALERAIWAAGRPSDRNALRAVLPVIEQHTARLRQQADDLIRRNTEYANRAIDNGQRTETARTELRRARALHADTERRLTDALADEVRKREAARNLHRPYNLTSGEQRCFTCVSTEAYPTGVAIHEPWPCPTVRALDTTKEN